MQPKTTLKDLANLVGVSVSTVSKALNDSPEIGLKTRQKIKEVAESCNYVPNNIARSLKTKSTKTIGVIIPAILIEFFNKVLFGIEQEATQRGYKIIICLSNESSLKEVESINTFLNGSVDGVILSVAEETQKNKMYDHFNTCLKHKMPVVMFDRVLKDIACDKVVVDDFEGAYKTTHFLANLGCKSILFLNPISNISVGQLREEGYKKAVKDIAINERIVHVSHYNDIEKVLSTVLKNETIDAIFASEEYSAAIALNVARLNGFRIPEDISVIGFTNGLVAKYAIPSLTVVSQHAEKIGKISAGLLLDRIEGKLNQNPVTKIVKTKIVERNSTRTL